MAHTQAAHVRDEIVEWMHASAVVLVLGVVLLLALGVPLHEIVRMFVNTVNRLF